MVSATQKGGEKELGDERLGMTTSNVTMQSQNSASPGQEETGGGYFPDRKKELLSSPETEFW